METKFKKWCVERNLTARQVAEKTGLTKRAIHTYFDGSRSPSSPARKKLRDNLNLDTGKIFDE